MKRIRLLAYEEPLLVSELEDGEQLGLQKKIRSVIIAASSSF